EIAHARGGYDGQARGEVLAHVDGGGGALGEGALPERQADVSARKVAGHRARRGADGGPPTRQRRGLAYSRADLRLLRAVEYEEADIVPAQAKSGEHDHAVQQVPGADGPGVDQPQGAV